MGWMFHVKHANAAAYLTVPSKTSRRDLLRSRRSLESPQWSDAPSRSAPDMRCRLHLRTGRLDRLLMSKASGWQAQVVWQRTG